MKERTLAIQHPRRAFIRSFVKEVMVTGDEAVLNYSMPVMLDKATIE